jgi:hypothetical protein
MKATVNGIEIEGTPQEIKELIGDIVVPKKQVSQVSTPLFKKQLLGRVLPRQDVEPKKRYSKINNNEFYSFVKSLISEGKTTKEIDTETGKHFDMSKGAVQNKRSELGLVRGKFTINQGKRGPNTNTKTDGRRNTSPYNMFMKDELTNINKDPQFNKLHTDEKFLLAVSRWNQKKANK